MSVIPPSIKAIFADLRLRKPESVRLMIARYGLRQAPLNSLHLLLKEIASEDKNFEHDLLGEANAILKFAKDPMSWGLRITSPVPEKPTTLYFHARIRVHEVVIQDEEDLIRAVEDLLRCTDALAHWRFDEAKRAVKRRCLLDACVELFTPFGLRSCFEMKGKENVKDRVVFDVRGLGFGLERRFYVGEREIIRALRKVSKPEIWIERVDAWFDLNAYGGSTGERSASEGNQASLREGLRTCVMIRGLHDTVDLYDAKPSRKLQSVFEAAELTQLICPYKPRQREGRSVTQQEQCFLESLVYDLASPADRLALAECILKVRDEALCESLQDLPAAGWSHMRRAPLEVERLWEPVMADGDIEGLIEKRPCSNGCSHCRASL